MSLYIISTGSGFVLATTTTTTRTTMTTTTKGGGGVKCRFAQSEVFIWHIVSEVTESKFNLPISETVLPSCDDKNID